MTQELCRGMEINGGEERLIPDDVKPVEIELNPKSLNGINMVRCSFYAGTKCDRPRKDSSIEASPLRSPARAGCFWLMKEKEQERLLLPYAREVVLDKRTLRFTLESVRLRKKEEECLVINQDGSRRVLYQTFPIEELRDMASFIETLKERFPVDCTIFPSIEKTPEGNLVLAEEELGVYIPLFDFEAHLVDISPEEITQVQKSKSR